MPNDDLQKAISDMEKSNKETDEFIKKMQTKLDEADFEYLKMKLEEDLNQDKMARDILDKQIKQK